MGVQTLFHLHTYMLAPSTLVLFHHQVSGVRYRNNILHHVAMFHCHHHSGKEGLEDLVSAMILIDGRKQDKSWIDHHQLYWYLLPCEHSSLQALRSFIWHCTCMSTHACHCM